MKLYATTTSERASKGQGGNEYLEIKLLDDKKNEFASFFIAEMPDGIMINYDIDEDVAYLEKGVVEPAQTYKEKKGNKQKTAKTILCNWCRKPATRKDYREIDGTTGSLPSCDDCFTRDTEYLLKKYSQ